MSCYTRHLIPLMKKAGAEPTPDNRKMMDVAVRKFLGMERADCDDVWAKVKSIMDDISGKRSRFEADVTKEFVRMLVVG